jgi:hypothetical protein
MDNNNFVMPQFPEIGWNIPEPQVQHHQQHHPPEHAEEAWQPVQHEEPVIQPDPVIEEEDAVEEDVDSSIVNASADSNNVIDNGENEVQQNVVINSALICLQEPLLVKQSMGMELIHSFLGTDACLIGPSLPPLMQCQKLLQKALPFVAPSVAPTPSVLHEPFKFVLLAKRAWSEAFQQSSVFSPSDGNMATVTVYLQAKKRVIKPVARMLTFGEDSDTAPSVFSVSSPTESGNKVVRRKRAHKAAAPLVDTSVRRSTRSSAIKDGHRHVALIDKRAPVSKKRKVQRRLTQKKDCCEATPKSFDAGKDISMNGSPGQKSSESAHFTPPPTHIPLLQ